MNSLRNVLKKLGVALLLTLTVCGLGWMANAQTPVPAPSIVFSVADGATIYKAWGVYPITMTASDTAGLRSITFSGGYSATVAFPSPGSTSMSVRLWFYCGYFPAGDYAFRATATGADGHQSQQAILLHVK